MLDHTLLNIFLDSENTNVYSWIECKESTFSDKNMRQITLPLSLSSDLAKAVITISD